MGCSASKIDSDLQMVKNALSNINWEQIQKDVTVVEGILGQAWGLYDRLSSSEKNTVKDLSKVYFTP